MKLYNPGMPPKQEDNSFSQHGGRFRPSGDERSGDNSSSVTPGSSYGGGYSLGSCSQDGWSAPDKTVNINGLCIRDYGSENSRGRGGSL